MMTFNLNHFIPDLSQRALTLELMDDASADESMLHATLRDFKYINRFLSQIRRVLRKTVFADIRRRRAREVSFLDIAAGGCDTAVWFTRQCRRLGVKCSVYCLDKTARAAVREGGMSRRTIDTLPAGRRPRYKRSEPFGRFALTDHFLHHLPDNDIPAMLRAIHGCCKHGFVVHDLEFHFAWYFGFTFHWRNVLAKRVHSTGRTLVDSARVQARRT